MRGIDAEVKRLARLVGIDVGAESNRALLLMPTLNTQESADLLRIPRNSIQSAIDDGRLRHRARRHGSQRARDIKPLHLLQWASTRAVRFRFVDVRLAYRYALQDGVIDDLPEDVREWFFGHVPGDVRALIEEECRQNEASP